MGIEPLGTVMTLQMQSAPKAVETPKVEAVDKDASQPATVDMTTPTVVATSESDKGNSGEQKEQEQQYQADHEKIKNAVEQMNKNMNQSEAVFGFHDDTNRITIKIVDKETKEVIKEVPPEKTLDMISKVWEMAGILVDEKR